MKYTIQEKKCDIIELLNEMKDTSKILFHQANCFNTLGKARGLAGVLDKQFPQIVKVDQETEKGDINKLGTYTYAEIDKNLIIVNLYGQYHYGMDKNTVYTHYISLEKAFKGALKELQFKFHKEPVLLIPRDIGSGLANGDKDKIHKIINSNICIFGTPIFDVIYFYR